VVTRDEIYAHLWPEFSHPDTSANPYDHQISDHKWKITIQIKRVVKGITPVDSEPVKDVIKTARICRIFGKSEETASRHSKEAGKASTASGSMTNGSGTIHITASRPIAYINQK